MKRLLILLLFFFASIGAVYPQVTVTGQVLDSVGNPVSGSTVYVYYETNYDTTVSGTVINGSYSVILPNPPVGPDSIIVEYYACSQVYTVKSYADNQTSGTVIMPDIIIPCHPDLDIAVVGQVLDSLGLPVPHVYVGTYAYPFMDMTMTDMNGYFGLYITMPSLDDSLLTLRVFDRCGNYKLVNVTLKYPDTAYVYPEVSCGLQPRVIVEGKIIDTVQGGYYDGAVVWAQIPPDTIKYMSVVDYNNNFIFELPVPSDGSTINLWMDQINDTLGVIQSTSSVIFDGFNYVYLDTLFANPQYSPITEVYVDGSVLDVQGNGAPGINISAWFQSLPSKRSLAMTDSSGYYNLKLVPPPVNSDSIIVEFKDKCGNTYYSRLAYNSSQGFYSGVDYNGVSCPGLPPKIEISGIVKDERGNGVAGVHVYVLEGDVYSGYSGPQKPMETTGSYDCFTNEYGFYKFVLDVPPDHPMPITIIVEDFCYRQYAQAFTFDFPQLVYDHKDFTVKCAVEDMYIWEGVVNNSSGNPLPGVKLVGSLLHDTLEPIITVTDLNGHYIFRTTEPQDSLILMKVIDGCDNILYDTISFNPNQYHYVNDYVMQCAGPIPDTVISFIGNITDLQGNPVNNQLVEVSLIDTISYDTLLMYTISDEQGFYSISLPVPDKDVLTHINVTDDCGNVYEKRDTFNYTNYVYRNDFQISCPPNFSPMLPNLAIGYQPDWQEFNKFNFFIEVMNIPDTLVSLYVWRLAFDTIATMVPEVSYTFPAMDTCFDVGVKVITKDGKEMKSPLLKVCIQDPFAELRQDCYVDFLVSRVNIAQNIFEFIPFMQSKKGLLASEATWDFGDGNVLTIIPPDTLDKPVIHQYTTQGIYDVTYTVTFQDTANNQCTAVWTDPVWVGHDVWYPDSCAAVFYVVLDSTDYKKVHFEDISYPGDSAQINYYYWDFGDGDIDYAPSPTHVYDTVGLYDVTMQIITNRGCVDEREVVVKIQEGLEPLFFFPDTVVKSAKGYAVKYRNISKSDNDKWGWDFGDAEKSYLKTSADTVIHVYADTGVYKVTLTNLTTNASVSMDVHVKSATEVEPMTVTLTPGQQATAVEDVYKFEDLTIYPNPVDDKLSVMFAENNDQIKLEIINLRGQIVKTIYAYNTDYVGVSVKDLPSGTYILRATHGNKVGLARFVKQ